MIEITRWAEFKEDMLPSSDQLLLPCFTTEPDSDYPEADKPEFFGQPRKEMIEEALHEKVPWCYDVTLIEQVPEYTDIVELIMSDEWIDECIDCTTEHCAQRGTQYDLLLLENNIKLNPGFTRSRCIIKGFFAILLGTTKNLSDLHKIDSTLGDGQFSQTMPRSWFFFLLKHIRITNVLLLPKITDPTYKAFQNIDSGIETLRQNSTKFWKLGKLLSYDDGRVLARSRRQPHRNRVIKKPTAQWGITINFIADRARHSNGFAWSHIITTGKKQPGSYNDGRDTIGEDKANTLNFMRQKILDDEMISGSGRVILADNANCDTDFLEIAGQQHIGVIFTCSPYNTKHLPRDLRKAKKQFKCDRGDIRAFKITNTELEPEIPLHFTIYNDGSGPQCMLSNCTKNFTSEKFRRNHGPRELVHVPINNIVYNAAHTFVDTLNAHNGRHPLDYKTKRKQNRTMFRFINCYVFINAFHIYKNSEWLWMGKFKKPKYVTFSKLRAEVANKWFQNCIRQIGINKHYKKKKLSESEKKQTYSIERKKKHKLVHIDLLNSRKSRRCVQCGLKSTWRCDNCFNLFRCDGWVTLCKSVCCGRQCNSNFHNLLE